MDLTPSVKYMSIWNDVSYFKGIEVNKLTMSII
jgi:hypothetical protein